MMFNRIFAVAVIAVIMGIWIADWHRVAPWILATAIAAPDPILLGLRAIATDQADDGLHLVGLRAFAEFATSEGFPISTSSMQKHCSPAIGTGPQIIGYWGKLPMSTRGLVRAWIRARLRPVRQVAQQKPIPA